ncbi:MAG: hypothetical protein ACD_5C00342G0006 [uncultured bacterium]|nr:MAG: hypothetical protein ACD_5C00342G0006 [uncultured bacterium]
MIYLIGGAPRCGKSILAKKLAKKLDVQFFQCDYLRPIIIAYTPKNEMDQKFPLVKMYDENGCDNNKLFKNFSPEELLQADIIEARTLWLGIKEFIKQKAVLGRDVIVEGVQLLPELVDEIKKEKYVKDLKAVYLIKENEQKILEGFKKNTQNDWLIQDSNSEETLLLAARMVCNDSEYFKKEAAKYGFEVFNSDEEFENVLDTALDFLINKKSV